MAHGDIHGFALRSKPCDVRLDRHSSVGRARFEPPATSRCRTSSTLLTITTSTFPAATLCVWQDIPTFDASKMRHGQGAGLRAKPSIRGPSSPRRWTSSPRSARELPAAVALESIGTDEPVDFEPPAAVAPVDVPAMHEPLDAGPRPPWRCRPTKGMMLPSMPPWPPSTFIRLSPHVSTLDPPRGKVASLVPASSLALFWPRFSMV